MNIKKFDPMKRHENNDLLNLFDTFKGYQLCTKSLDLIHSYVLVLNETAQIVFANRKVLNSFGIQDVEITIGQRIGEILKCVNRDRGSGGCGTSEECENCSIMNFIVNMIDGKLTNTSEVRFLSEADKKVSLIEFEISAEIIHQQDNKCYLITMVDISDRIRKKELEHIFFHDVLNSAGGINGFLSMLSKEIPHEMKEDFEFLQMAFSEMIDTIQIQRRYVNNGNRVMDIQLKDLNSECLLKELKRTFEVMEDTYQGRIEIHEDSQSRLLRMDPLILKRILFNMIKNALESTGKNEIVTFGGKANDSNQFVWHVHNPTYISEEAAYSIFSKGYSTKDPLRGWGTTSMKLLGENCLNGKVYFESDLKTGTTFYFEHPIEWED